MPIRFRCPGCSEPIEVDDVHAGQAATCPYCRRVVTVPQGSTYSPETAPTARPSSAAPPGLTPTWAGPAVDAGAGGPLPDGGPRRTAGRVTGTIALVCASLAIVLAFAAKFSAPPSLLEKLSSLSRTSQPVTPDEQRQQANELVTVVTTHSFFFGGICSSFLLVLLGLILGIISVVQRRRGNWQGIAALVLCALYLPLQCLGRSG